MNKKEWNIPGMTTGTWARTIVMIIAIINMWLIELGRNPLPEEITAITFEQLQGWISKFIETVTMLWVYWKNNSCTTSAQAGDVTMWAIEAQRKQGELEYTEKIAPHTTDHYHGRG